MPVAPASPARFDPSRTGLLRRRALAEALRRWRAFERDLGALIVAEDALGAGRWAMLPLQGKVEAVRRWAAEKAAEHLGGGWLAPHLLRAWRHGCGRTWGAMGGGRAVLAAWGGREAFVMAVDGRSDRPELHRAQAEAALEEIRGAMSLRTARACLDGALKRLSPRAMLAAAKAALAPLGNRLLDLARTEPVRGAAWGQLDGMAFLGVEEVSLVPERRIERPVRNADPGPTSTGYVKLQVYAGACPLCQGFAGVTVRVEEAYGFIPLHPSCRCSWRPAGRLWIKRRRRGPRAVDPDKLEELVED